MSDLAWFGKHCEWCGRPLLPVYNADGIVINYVYSDSDIDNSTTFYYCSYECYKPAMSEQYKKRRSIS